MTRDGCLTLNGIIQAGFTNNMLFLKFLENILVFILAIIFAIPYFIYRYFKPKRAKIEKENQNIPPKTTKQSTVAFATLEIAPTTNMEIIKSAYRNLAKKHHPDHNGNPQIFIKIQKAYEELTQ